MVDAAVTAPFLSTVNLVAPDAEAVSKSPDPWLLMIRDDCPPALG